MISAEYGPGNEADNDLDQQPPRKPRIAPAGTRAMIIAGRRLLLLGAFDGRLPVNIVVAPCWSGSGV
jgi:hypothetical protein